MLENIIFVILNVKLKLIRESLLFSDFLISWKKIKQPHWYIDAEINDRNLFKNKMSDY